MQEEEFRSGAMDPAPPARRGRTANSAASPRRRSEDYRDRAGVPGWKSTARDLRYALRGLRRTPGFHRCRGSLAGSRHRR